MGENVKGGELGRMGGTDVRRAARYRAFLSYSHSDEAAAGKLHRALENYVVPQHLRPETHKNSRKTIAPIFRDKAELTAAASLPDTIKAALRDSEFLIVLASPAAKASSWVNDEIRYFRETHGPDKILCALLSGTPDTSFPDALTEGGREPLAADMSRRNVRLGLTQLAASMLGVGLDDLVQRDLKKARQRVTAITVTACIAMLIMGSLTWTAMSARQLADQRRDDAEGQIEFMITDLKDTLDSVGRLDALNIVGDRALSYYDGYPMAQHDEDALGRRAGVFHMLGEVQDLQGNFDQANRHFSSAYDASKALLDRNPDEADRLFDHSQSAYWVGASHYRRQDYDNSDTYFQIYRGMIERLREVEGDSDRVQQERIYALTNLGAVAMAQRDWTRANGYVTQTVETKLRLLEQGADTTQTRISVANSLVDMGKLRMESGNLVGAVTELDRALSVLNGATHAHDDFQVQAQTVITHRSLANVVRLQGDFAAAQSHLDKAQAIADRLSAIEPGNADTQFEQLQIALSGFQLAVQQGDAPKAADTLRVLQAGLASVSPDMLTDYRYESIRRPSQSFALYLSILSGDRKQQINAAKTLQNDFAAAPRGEQEPIVPSLITRMVLDQPLLSGEILQVCRAEGDRLSLIEKSALSTVFPADQCPAAYLGHTHPHTIFRALFGRLQTL